LFFYAIKHFYGGGVLGENGIRMKHTFFQNFPCLPYDETIEQLAGRNSIDFIEHELCQKYGLTDEELQAVIISD